jgi:D-threo-aldose 1-dehydrogenase
MLRHILGQTRLEVSQLGFGCVKLTTHADRHDAVQALETAFSEGITHFDVARAYGFGRAEGILGEFLQGKRARVTVATKFGIQPPSGIAGNRWAIDLAKKVLSPFPGLLQRAKQRGSAMVESGAFTPAAMLRSLETSLKELRTDYVDLLVLHEANLEEASGEPLLAAMQNQVKRGTIRAFGIASAFSKLGEAFERLPPDYGVLQFDDNASTRNRQRVCDTGRGLITHSVFHPSQALRDAMAANAELTNRFSQEIGADLKEPSVIGSLLLHYALSTNPNGVVLFSSSDRQRISQNVRDAASNPYDKQQLLSFTKFVDAALKPS